jgi:hypothetical protein
MKKMPALFLIAGMMICAAPASAGNTDIGIRAGVSFANVFGGKIFDQKSRAGFCGGLFLTHSFSSIFAIQPEVLFVMKGSRHSEGFGPNSLYEVMSIEYMEIPLLVRVRLPVSKSFDAHLLAGPALDFNIRARVNSVIGGRTEEESLDNINGVDYGVVAGAGLDIPVKVGKISLDIRYTFGLSSISKGPGGGIRNGAACFFVGYVF